jgi:anti-sigma factor RsiW
MNKPPSWTSREESLLLLNAYLDNELDAASVLDVERRIGSDATLKAELARLLELRNALSTHVGKERASDALRRRVAAIADTSKGLTVWRSLEATSNGTVASKARW